jgi:hypothetical protein
MHVSNIGMVSLNLERTRVEDLADPLRALATAVAAVPLFESSATSGGLAADALYESTASWFGVGLSGRHPSQGVPVDILQMVLAQEIVRRSLNLRRSFVLIADSNACAAGHHPSAIAAARERLEWTLLAVARQFRLPMELLSATSLEGPLHARALVRRVDTSNPYVAHQVAQMQIMRQGGAVRGFDYDERHFDRLHDRSFPAKLAYIYTRGGRSLSAARPRCSPYVCESRADRLLLEPGERLGVKLDRLGRDRRHPLVRGYHRLLAHLARAHRQLVGPNRPWAPEDRIQSIVDRLG